MGALQDVWMLLKTLRRFVVTEFWRPGRTAFHRGPQDAVDSGLITSPVRFQPVKDIGIYANRQLLFRR